MSSRMIREETSGDLAAVPDMAEATLSHHLGQLRKAGLVICVPR